MNTLRCFRNTVLELGNRAPDEDAIIFAYIYRLKEDV